MGRTVRLRTVGATVSTDELNQVLEKLDRIEATLALLVERETVKDFYDIDEVAKILGKASYTVREWARQGRIHAEKKASGRGKFQSWVVSHAELLRIRREGLLPIQRSA
jgi:Helix-turn-helix domain